jgi:hypothetical protein
MSLMKFSSVNPTFAHPRGHVDVVEVRARADLGEYRVAVDGQGRQIGIGVLARKAVRPYPSRQGSSRAHTMPSGGSGGAGMPHDFPSVGARW